MPTAGKTPESAPKPTPKRETEPNEKREPMKQPGQPNDAITSPTGNADEEEAAAIQRPPADS